MDYHGHVHNGVVVLDDPESLPEGAAVRLTLLATLRCEKQLEEAEISDYDRLSSVIGKAEGLPSDFAENHDHYIHGTPKR